MRTLKRLGICIGFFTPAGLTYWGLIYFTKTTLITLAIIAFMIAFKCWWSISGDIIKD